MGVAMDEHLGSIVSIASACPPRLAFMGRLLASTSFSSVTIAVMFGQIGTSLSIGPLVPAMVGGWLGYTWGLLKFWESEATRAKAYARDYPALMRYALATQFSTWEGCTWMSAARIKAVPAKSELLHDWLLSGGIGRLSLGILAAQYCSSSV